MARSEKVNAVDAKEEGRGWRKAGAVTEPPASCSPSPHRPCSPRLAPPAPPAPAPQPSPSLSFSHPPRQSAQPCFGDSISFWIWKDADWLEAIQHTRRARELCLSWSEVVQILDWSQQSRAFSLQPSRERERESLGKDPLRTLPAPCNRWIPTTQGGKRGGDTSFPAKRTNGQTNARAGLHAGNIWKAWHGVYKAKSLRAVNCCAVLLRDAFKFPVPNIA